MTTEFRALEVSPPVHKIVQDEIKNYIIVNALRAGDPLKPEAELARIFGVGRNSVREAVKALESTGVLETRRGSGVFVRAFSFEPLLESLPYGLLHGGDQRALLELLELRRVLETSLIGDAMRALSSQSRDAIKDVLATMRERAEAGDTVTDQDREFHRLLFVDLGNDMLLSLFELFWLALHRAMPDVPKRHPVEVYEAHHQIFDAVVAGDEAAVRAAVEDHYVAIQSRIRAGVDLPEATSKSD